MVTIGTVRVANLTAFAREGMVTCTVPLANTQFWSQSALATTPPTIAVTAVNAETAPGNHRAQVLEIGPRYASGNPRYIVVTFKVEIGAGVPTQAYGNYLEKLVTLTNDVTAGVTWVPHTAVSAAVNTTTFRLRIPYSNPTRTETLTFDMASVINFGEYEQEIVPTVQRVKSFKRFLRVIPANQPSFYGELLLEIPHDMRQCNFWFTYGNSYVAPHGSPQWSGVDHRLLGNINLEIDSPATVVVRAEETKLYQAPTVAGSVTTIRCITSTLEDRFNDGQCQVIYGTLLFATGAAGLEATTMQAEAVDALEAISINWPDHGTWGAVGYPMKAPVNTLMPGEAAITLLQAQKQCASDLAKYESANVRSPWFQHIHGLLAPAGSTGAQADFGASKGFHIGRSGAADMRALRISAYQEMSVRQMTFRYPNGDFMDAFLHTGRSGLWSDLYFFGARPFFINGITFAPAWGDNLGKEVGLNPFGGQPSSKTLAGAITSPWNPLDDQHNSISFCTIYTLMSGDRWARRQILMLEHNILAQMWPVYDSREPPPGGTAKTVSGLKSSRGEGRGFQCAANLYLITGDERIKQNMISRLVNVIETNWVGQFLARPAPRIMNVDGSATFGIQWPASGLGAQGQGKPINVWQQAICMAGFYMAWRVFGDVRFKNIAKELCYTITNNCARKNSASGNVWDIAVVVQFNPYTANGEALREEHKFDQLNPLTPSTAVFPGQTNPGHPYAVWSDIPSGIDLWALPAIVLAWEFAQEEGDQVWAQKAAEQFNDCIGNGTLESQKGNFGWGGSVSSAPDAPYTNNFFDWIALIEDPYKIRSLTMLTKSATFLSAGTFLAQGFRNPLLRGAIFQGLSLFTATPDVAGEVLKGAIFSGAGLFLANSFVLGPTEAAATFQSFGSFSAGYVITSPGTEPSQKIHLSGSFTPTRFFDLHPVGAGVTIKNQTFTAYQGDDLQLIFRLIDGNGNALNLWDSPPSNIRWILARKVGTPILISKGMLTGGIGILPRDNAETNKGRIVVFVSHEDTKLLSGRFYHEGDIEFGFTITHTVFVGQAILEPVTLLPPEA